MTARTKPAPGARRLLSLAAALASLFALACARGNYLSLVGFETEVALAFEPPETIALRVDQVPISRDDRVDTLVQMFRDVGCDGPRLALEHFNGSPTPNVVCTIPGRRAETIVVSSHHVLARGGRGLFDAWTSVALLPALYASLAREQRDFTIQLVGFASSVRKGDASLAYLTDDEERAERIVAMVWLDFLGLGDVVAWTERSDPNLFEDLVSAATSVGVQTGAVRLVGAGEIHDQSRAFRWHGIPTIYLHSLGESTKRVVSERKYDLDPNDVDQDAYYRTYRVLATYVAYLDKSLAARGF